MGLFFLTIDKDLFLLDLFSRDLHQERYQHSSWFNSSWKSTFETQPLVIPIDSTSGSCWGAAIAHRLNSFLLKQNTCTNMCLVQGSRLDLVQTLQYGVQGALSTTLHIHSAEPCSIYPIYIICIFYILAPIA